MMLEGKKAVITCADNAMGRAAAECFASYGADIWACAVDSNDEFEKFAAQLSEKYGVSVNTERLVSDMGTLPNWADSIDIFVNNASYTDDAKADSVLNCDQNELFVIDEGFNLLNLFSKKMSEQKRGTIVNILPQKDDVTAQASKSLLSFLNKRLSKELAECGIRVNAVESDAGHLKDTAEAAAFLASDRASYVTGQTVKLDGEIVLADETAEVRRDLPLLGKNAVVTGARRGIGRATVETLAKYGCNVWACARLKDNMFEQDMADISGKYNVWVRPIYFDMTDAEQMKNAVKEITKEKCSIDIVVNNAGIPHGALFSMISKETLERVFDTNYFSQLRLIQLLSRYMFKNKRGSIINLSSVVGLDAFAGYAAYGASKGAIATATKSISRDVLAYGVRINSVAPGLIDTDMGNEMQEKGQREMLDMSSMHRAGKASEVAEVIAFLASDNARRITGQILRIDGGM